MRRLGTWVVLLLLLLVVTSSAAPSAFLKDSLTRVSQTSTGTVTTLSLDAAGGEYESVQVVLRASSGGSSTLTLSDAAGLVLRAYTAPWAYVTKGSGQWPSNQNKGGGPGYYTWGLRSYSWGEPISLTANVNSVLWVDVYVPRGTPPGVRTVKLNAGGTLLSLPVTVYNVTLPVKPSLDSAIVLWNVRYDKAAEALLLDHRLQVEYLKPPSLNGQSVVGVGFWADATTTTVGRAVPTVAEVMAATAKYPGLRLHSYSFDELGTPSAGVYAKLLQFRKVLDDGGVSLLATVPPGRGWEGVVGTGVTMAHQPMWSPASGVIPWFYWTLEQDDYSPKGLLDKAPINWRHLTGFLPARLGYKGALYWAGDKWTASPWTNTEGSLGASYPGEGMLFLPGPAPTVILKVLRDGAEDYDLYTMAVAAGKKALADSYTQQCGTSWKSWTRDTPKVFGSHKALLSILTEPLPPPFWDVTMERTDTATMRVQAETAEEAKQKAVDGAGTAAWTLGLAQATGAVQVP
jgi:hypothetical protein